MLASIQWFTCIPLSLCPEKLMLFSAINVQYLLPEVVYLYTSPYVQRSSCCSLPSMFSTCFLSWFTCIPLSLCPEKLMLFSAINVQSLLPEEDPVQSTTIQKLWEQIDTDLQSVSGMSCHYHHGGLRTSSRMQHRNAWMILLVLLQSL